MGAEAHYSAEKYLFSSQKCGAMLCSLSPCVLRKRSYSWKYINNPQAANWLFPAGPLWHSTIYAGDPCHCLKHKVSFAYIK